MDVFQPKVFYHASTYQAFENQTKLPYRKISTNKFVLTQKTQDLLHRRRVIFFEQKISFETNGIDGDFLTASPKSFETLIMKNEMANYLPKLPSGIKEPDEFFINIEKRVAFIIEKKTQKVMGSVDEKIQTAPFKKYALYKKFKEG
jgi:hypothetical protein